MSFSCKFTSSFLIQLLHLALSKIKIIFLPILLTWQRKKSKTNRIFVAREEIMPFILDIPLNILQWKKLNMSKYVKLKDMIEWLSVFVRVLNLILSSRLLKTEFVLKILWEILNVVEHFYSPKKVTAGMYLLPKTCISHMLRTDVWLR